ncbi:MAG: hypothetical protein IKU65_00495 [Oscillospiraceae bacterium]|nr:hypothetical protein [Oscillospiraceae bacterium]
MMKHEIINHAVFGECLFVTNGTVEVKIPLSFGLRIGHFSLVGKKNVFFEQPDDMTDLTTPEGWRIRGGHRMWLAPEGNFDYFPDNAPIKYEISDDCITLTQEEDPWLSVIKSFVIKLDGAKLHITHKVTNTAKEARTCSLWPISAMAAGGVEYIDLPLRENGFDPFRHIALWDYTTLDDERAEYSRNQIKISHMPTDERYKIGIGHPLSPVRYELSDTVFLKHFEVLKEKAYPDGGVSLETFFCRHMAEVETLSPVCTIESGQTAEYSETWELLHK